MTPITFLLLCAGVLAAEPIINAQARIVALVADRILSEMERRLSKGIR